MAHLLKTLAVLVLALPIAAQAQSKPQSKQGVLVELYTSQGCSSCPPADAFLAELAQQSGVIPLALHVDYWDYIGWNDTFAQKIFSDRQRDYAADVNDNMVYTPQMIVAGGARIKGHNRGSAQAEIAASRSDVDLTITRQGDTITVHAQSARALPGGIAVDLVRYHPKSVVEIERGENRGLAIAYNNIVTSWQNIGQWSGQGALELTARASGDAPVVVVLQRSGPGQVLAAAVLK